MQEFIVAVIVIISIITLLIAISRKTKKKGKKIEEMPIPANLGIQLDGILPIVTNLDQTLSNFYVSDVKYRFMQEHPKVEDYEFDWFFFELKRYFIMNSLLKSVPMFSPGVDEIWHEMLMFTRDYEKFSNDFYGEPLHHTPNMDETPIPGERGFFDWVYLSLFTSTPNSRVIWGGFLRNAIKPEIIEDFKVLSEEELLNEYFRPGQVGLDVKQALIRKFKQEINVAEEMDKKDLEPTRLSNSMPETQLFHLAVGAAVFYSLYETDFYDKEMEEVLPDEYYKSAPLGTTGSACSGFACSSSSDNDSGGDSGGSSCSSCGSGCSS